MAHHHLLCGYLIFMMLAYHSSSQSTRCSPGEAEALMTIDSQCEWAGPECCSFYGVTCDGAGHVIEVDLLECSEYINIAPNSSFFQLRYLRLLKVKHFNVKSTIPDEIGQLSELRQLTVYTFGGDIPSTIGNLSKLENLGLLYGQSSQRIPDSIGNLRNLERINLVDIGLTGEIPAFFRNLRALRYLTLHGNRLSGRLPFFLFREMNLTGIFASDNLLEGPLPLMLPRSSSLGYLYLSNNKLSGPLPRWVSKLRVIQLSNNRFSGPIVPFQAPSTSVSSIHLDGNLLEGSPSSLFGMVNCYEMLLGDNRFSGVLDIRALKDMNGLRTLNVSSNKGLSLLNVGRDSLLKDGSSILPILETLNLDHCDLTFFPSFLGALSGLQVVSLSNNRMQGPIGMHEGWSSLANLDASFNSLSGEIPILLGNLTRLQSLDLSSNKLVGTIPENLLNSESLFFANFSNNQLICPIPPGKFIC